MAAAAAAPTTAAADDEPRRQRRRSRATRPTRRSNPRLHLLLFFPLVALVLLALCPSCPRPASAQQGGSSSAAAAQQQLASRVPALATDEGREFLASLPPDQVTSLASGVEAMTSERKQSLASMPLEAVKRVFGAATAAKESPSSPSSSSSSSSAGGRAAAVAQLAAKGLGNDDGLLDEPTLKTLRALAGLPASRLGELAALRGDARAAAVAFFADGVGACASSSARGGGGV